MLILNKRIYDVHEQSLTLFPCPRVNAVALPTSIRIHRRIFALPGVFADL